MSGDTLDIRNHEAARTESVASEYGLDNYGFRELGRVHWNLGSDRLIQAVSSRSEGTVTASDQVVVSTGNHTDLARHDKFVVRESATRDLVWWGEYHRPFDLRKYSAIYRRTLGFAVGRELFVQDCYSGNGPEHRLKIRVVCENAWQALVARNLFTAPSTEDDYRGFVPEFTVFLMPSFRALPEVDGTDSDTFILLNLDQGICLIGGTAHSGEIKKAVIAAQNFRLSQNGALALHSAANVNSDGQPALFAGPCASGKTSLVLDSANTFRGDDTQVWHDDGLTCLESGCYARVTELSPESEPELLKAIAAPHTVFENVEFDQDNRKINCGPAGVTANGRAAFRLSTPESENQNQACGHPEDLFILACDATGVLPALARLTPDQAAYHFLSGYTCKVSASDSNSGKTVNQTFDPCCDSYSTMSEPSRQARMLRDKLVRYDVRCWLVNTGWAGAAIGDGERIGIQQTRKLIHSARSGRLEKVDFSTDPVFGFRVPIGSEEYPKRGWADPGAFEEARTRLALMYVNNFKKFEAGCNEAIVHAGPKLGDK